MSDDLKGRLRKLEGGDKYGSTVWYRNPDGPEAADRIETLKDELHHCFHRINELQAALREIVGALDDPKGGQHVYDMRNASYIARKALEGKDD
jgi:hypothetical protein